LRHEGGGRGSSRDPSTSQAAHTASRAPPVTSPPPTSCHRARSPHQPPPDPEGRRGKREQPRPNGLLSCPHTLHPPRRLRRPAATEGDRRADQPLQPEGETEEGGAAEANGGPPRLLSHPPRRHRHPTCSRRASAHRRPLLSSPAGSSLLALPGAASPLKRMSPNRIYRPATRSTPSDLRPAAQHEKTRPRTPARALHRKRRGEPRHHLPCSPLRLCRGASSGSGMAEGEGEAVAKGGSGSRLPCHLSDDAEGLSMGHIFIPCFMI
jgi:hypothetical protein